jgi:hypothetical protein
VYIADSRHDVIKEWVRTSNAVSPLVSSGLNGPCGLAIDANGNLYIADTGDNVIKEWVRSSNTIATLVSSGLNSPLGGAVDGSGDVYIADTFNSSVEEWISSANAVVALVPVSDGLAITGGVAVDTSNNVYIADTFHNSIQVLAGGLIFTQEPENATATIGQASSVSLTVALIGGTAPLSYQWQISTDNGLSFRNLSDGNGVAGAATPTLTLGDFTTPGSAEYQAVVTDTDGATATSTPATVTINPAPTTTSQPQDATSAVGPSAFQSFSVGANGGSGSLSVQWLVSTDNLAKCAPSKPLRGAVEGRC